MASSKQLLVQSALGSFAGASESHELLAYRVPEEGPQEAVDLVEACMKEAPDERPTAKDIVNFLRKDV